jgi:hypothetical protein
MKDVDDVRPATRGAVVNEVISRGETKKSTLVVRHTLARAGIFAKQPETFGDPIYYFFGDWKADASGPVFENLVEIPLGSF